MTSGSKSTTPTTPTVANPPVVFRLTPYDTHKGKLLDYDNNKQDAKLFDRMSRPFLATEERFDCNPTQIFDLIDVARQHATKNGWIDKGQNAGICMIPEEMMQDGSLSQNRVSIFDNYGKLAIETIKAYEMTYLGTQHRNAQNAQAWFMSLFGSLSQSGRNKVTPNEEDYTLEINGQTYQSGNLLLKVILDNSVISSKVVIRCLKQELLAIEKTIAEFEYDIIKFNDYVKRKVHELMAHGEEPYFLTHYLFLAYEKIECAEFNKYIVKKKDDEDDGKVTYDWKELTKLAETKYKALKRENNWTVKDPRKEEILALKAEIKSLKKSSSNRNNSNKNRNGKRSSPPSTKFDVNKAPKDGDPVEITVKNKPMYWCHSSTGGHCNKWRRHKPSDCDPSFYNDKKNSDKSGNSKSKSSNKKSGNQAGGKSLVANETILKDAGSSSDSDEFDHDMEVDEVWRPAKKQK